MASNVSSLFMRITKEESISTLTHDTVKNTLVLSISEPFPGYYGQNFVMSSTSPGTVLFVLAEEADFENFFRKNHKIQQYCEYDFDATLAMVYFNNQKLPAIRIKDVKEFAFLREIQQDFMDEGFKMRKAKKINTKAIIKISKFGLIKKHTEGIYVDDEDENFKYIEIPFKINWQLFAKMTYQIKQNISTVTFDAAKGVFYTKDRMIDYVRVYSKNISDKDIELLRAKYLEAIDRYDFISG